MLALALVAPIIIDTAEARTLTAEDFTIEEHCKWHNYDTACKSDNTLNQATISINSPRPGQPFTITTTLEQNARTPVKIVVSIHQCGTVWGLSCDSTNHATISQNWNGNRYVAPADHDFDTYGQYFREVYDCTITSGSKSCTVTTYPTKIDSDTTDESLMIKVAPVIAGDQGIFLTVNDWVKNKPSYYIDKKGGDAVFEAVIGGALPTVSVTGPATVAVNNLIQWTLTINPPQSDPIMVNYHYFNHLGTRLDRTAAFTSTTTQSFTPNAVGRGYAEINLESGNGYTVHPTNNSVRTNITLAAQDSIQAAQTPTITIQAASDRMTEGDVMEFTVYSNPSVPYPVTVPLSVDTTGTFPYSHPASVVIPSSAGKAHFNVTTHVSLDKTGGTLTASIVSSEDYDVGYPSSTTVTVLGSAQPLQQSEPTNLISNGSFEAPTVTANEGTWEHVSTTTDGIGWDASGGTLELHRGILGGASDGQQHTELDVDGSSAVTISQAVSTTSGENYTISFDYKARPGEPSHSNGVTVSWNGTNVTPTIVFGNTWKTATVQVTGTGNDTISFTDTGTVNGRGTFLDNVSVMLSQNQQEQPAEVEPVQQPVEVEPVQPPVIPVNLLVNPSFESPTVTANEGTWEHVSTTTDGIGWSATGGKLELQRGILGGASDGQQHTELDVDGSSAVTISQTVTTTTGHTYEISFDYKSRPGEPSNSNGITVSWNGTDVTPAISFGSTWKTATVQVTGTGSDTISFTDAGTVNGRGTFLDNVSVMIVP